jgi:hypothetical protein
MTTVTLTPDGLFSTAGTVTAVPSGTLYAVAADPSTANYVHGLLGSGANLAFNSTTLPAGSMVKTVTLKFAARWWGAQGTFGAILYDSASGYQWSSTSSPLLGSTFFTFTSPAAGWALTQTQVDNLAGSFGASGEWDLSYAACDLTYATQPTVTVSAPTGTLTTTNTPTVQWSYMAGSDGGPQAKWRVRVFSAAQYGAGGFDPATSPATYDSGDAAGSNAAFVLPPLPNATYRAYVRGSQTINGFDHWSNYAFSGFTVNATSSDITSVAATALSATARNQIVITRNAATPLWTSVEVQKSYDGGATWAYVRGYTRFAPPSTPFTLYDYEAPNGTAATYRARATYQLSGLDITGAWVTSSAATWTSTSLWLKDVAVPARNMAVENVLMPEPTYGRTQGVFQPVGAVFPVVVSDVRQAGRSTITLETLTAADETALRTLCSGAVLLLQAPTTTGFGWGNRYVAPGTLRESRKTQEVASEWRLWELDLVEVAQPPDAGIS